MPDENKEVKYTKTIKYKVNQDVVRHLSIGLYTNFARAIKELISNSYDAKALETRIRLNIEEKSIIIRDDGDGMTAEEIEDRLFNLAYLKLVETPEKDDLGRLKIGAFGIGFVSIYPYCEKVQLITKKKHSDDMSEISIETSRFYSGGKLELRNIPIQLKVLESDLPYDKGETIIRLEGIGEQYLRDLKRKEEGRASIDKLSGYEKFKWTICQYAPIQFPPERIDLRSIFDSMYGKPMRLWLDGDELFRNVPDEAQILEDGEKSVGVVKFKYAIMTPYGPIEPEEARGLQIRYRNVGIGFPTDLDVVKLTGANLGKINYLCGEVHVLSDLSKYILIDRDRLSYTNEIQAFYEYFREKIKDYSWNLEKLAKEEKPVYQSLSKLKEKDEIIQDLKKAGALHFDGGRIRTNSASSRKKKKYKPTSPIEKTASVFSDNGFKVVMKGKPDSPSSPPIKVFPEEKTILIYEKHTGISEKIIVFGKEYQVEYSHWDAKDSMSPACKIDGQKVVYNLNHPLLSVANVAEDIKKMVLSIHVLSKTTLEKDLHDMTNIFYRVLAEVFLKE